MKNLLIVLGFICVITFTTNAQSKDGVQKEKGDTTKVEKCTQHDQTMKCCDKVEKTTTTTKDGKEVACNKTDMKEKCGETSSCCNMKKETKVEKEVEKK